MRLLHLEQRGTTAAQTDKKHTGTDVEAGLSANLQLEAPLRAFGRGSSVSPGSTDGVHSQFGVIVPAVAEPAIDAASGDTRARRRRSGRRS